MARTRGRPDNTGDGMEEVLNGGDGGETIVGTVWGDGLVKVVTFALMRKEFVLALDTLLLVSSAFPPFCGRNDGAENVVRLSSNTVAMEPVVLSTRAERKAAFEIEAGFRISVDLVCCNDLTGDPGLINFDGEGDLTVNFVGEGERTPELGVRVDRVLPDFGVPLTDTEVTVLVCVFVRAEPLTLARMTTGCPETTDGASEPELIGPIATFVDGLTIA